MALSEKLVLKSRGLYTYSDQLSEVPEGSLRVAENVVIDKDGLFSPRRGYQNLKGTIVGAIRTLLTYTENRTNYLLSHRDDDTLAYYDDNTESWVDYGQTIVSPAAANQIRSAEANKNLYLTSSRGIQKIDTITGNILDSGAPEALDVELSLVGSGTAIPNDGTNRQAVSYRVVWGYRDANNNLILGPPSSKNDLEVPIGSGASDVQLDITIPTPPVTTDWFVQVYRSTVLTGVGATVGEPVDNLGLVLERNPSSAEITAGTMTVTDTAPDELIGADLYTNENQQGILQSNFSPPQAVDMALYQNHLFFANTESQYSATISLLAVDATSTNPNALQPGDTLSLDGVTYTAALAEDIGANEFLIANTGSPANNLEQTARSIIRVVNRSASNSDIWAIYDSGSDDVPGRIRITERDFGSATAFTYQSSRGQSFSPDITDLQLADNEQNPNRLYFSKFQQPEAVPLLNFFEVGAANDEIIRILPLRSILLIFTTAGTYKLTGATASSFQVSLLDDTAILEAPDSLVALNNNAIGLFDQGIAQVSYGSVQILSRPIEGDINAIRGATGDKLSELTFGISYETDRKYMIGLPTGANSTKADIIYVYNVFTQSWTTYDLSKRGGIVRREDDKLYLCEDDSVIQERKTFSESDYAEPAIEVTTVSVNEAVVEVSSTDNVLAGYQYFEDNSKYSIILEVDPINNLLTLQDNLNWNTGAAEIRPYIVTTIEWNPVTVDSPNTQKQFSETTLLVNRPIVSATLSFRTLTSSFFESVSISDNSVGDWGLFEWGDVPWGGSTTIFRYRTWVPRNKQKDSAIVLKLGQNTIYNDFEVSGWSLIYRPISQRVTR